MDDLWHCFFEDEEGRVLMTPDGWTSPEEAAMWGSRIMDRPDDFELVDPDGAEVEAILIDPDRDFQVEMAN